MIAETEGMPAQDFWSRPDETTLQIMRRLGEPGAVLAMAAGMEKAVIVRNTPGSEEVRTAVAECTVVETLADRGWIHCDAPGRLSRYRITPEGRSALGRFLAEQESRAVGLSEAAVRFTAAQNHSDTHKEPGVKRSRYKYADSPLLALSRRRDKDGSPFLSAALVTVGERLREDFELSNIGREDAAPTDWRAVLQGAELPEESAEVAQIGVAAARARVAAALRALGPGLGDVVLLCCCELEGLEIAEKRMGWSARSGKIVLRIALQQLRRYYEIEKPMPVLIG